MLLLKLLNDSLCHHFISLFDICLRCELLFDGLRKRILVAFLHHIFVESLCVFHVIGMAFTAIYNSLLFRSQTLIVRAHLIFISSHLHVYHIIVFVLGKLISTGNIESIGLMRVRGVHTKALCHVQSVTFEPFPS